MSAGLSSGLHAQSVDRTHAPATEELDAVEFPHFEEFSLSNGLKVFFVPDERPSVTLRLLIPGGVAVDGEKPGRAEILADMLTKGSSGLSAQTFASEIDFLGGSVNATADEDRITVSAGGLKSRIEPIMKLYTGVITDPAIDESELEKYRSLTIEGLKAQRQSASFLASQAVSRVLYGDTPLGAMPSEESIMAIDDDDLREYHSEYFSPTNAILAVVGNFETDELKSLLEGTLGKWDVTTEPEIPENLTSFSGGRVILVDRPASVQSAIRIVGPGPRPWDDDRTRTKVVGDILGGGTGLGNRLTSNLRETHGWTYSPYAYFTSNRYAGYHVAAADVRNEVTDSAITEMLSEIRGMTADPVPDDELGLNIRSAAGTYVMSLANPNITALRVQQIEFYGMDRDYYDRLVDVYHATGSDDVQALSRKYFQPADQAIVVVGKASEIAESLGKFGNLELWDTELEPVRRVDAADIEMNAEEVWGRMLEAIGGTEDLRRVRSISSKGESVLSAGGQQIPGTFTIVQKYPGSEYLGIEISMGGQTMNIFEQKVTAEGAVQFQQGSKVPLDRSRVDSIVAATHILSEAWLQEMGGNLKLEGMKKTKDGEVYTVSLHIPGTTPQTYEIDTDTFLPIRRTVEGMEMTYGNWKEVDGDILQPGSMTYVVSGQEIRVSDIEYDVNEEVDDALFELGE